MPDGDDRMMPRASNEEDERSRADGQEEELYPILDHYCVLQKNRVHDNRKFYLDSSSFVVRFHNIPNIIVKY